MALHAKPVRPGSWPASTASIQARSIASQAAGEHLAEVAVMPGCGVQLGAAGQDVLHGDAVLLAQGRGMAGENGRHRRSNRSNHWDHWDHQRCEPIWS